MAVKKLASNPWRILGVHRKSTDAEIQAAFHKVARDCHPDMLLHVRNKKVVEASLLRYEQCAGAYNLLKDQKRRKQVIENITLYYDPCKACAGTGVKSKSTGMTTKVYNPCQSCGGSGFNITNEMEMTNAIELSTTGASGGHRSSAKRGVKGSDKLRKH